MADEINVAGKIYISSKRAAKEGSYTQDYIGQLARGGKIDAKRVGGLWFVYKESLDSYKKGAEEYKPIAPEPSTKKDPTALVSFDGKEYISASRASENTGYNQDYIGQLARSGKILSRQVGNRWYIENESLMAHKREKDALLAGVQVESVGLSKNPLSAGTLSSPAHREPSLMTYTPGHGELLPVLNSSGDDKASQLDGAQSPPVVPYRIVEDEDDIAPVPIRVVKNIDPTGGIDRGAPSPKNVRSNDKTIFKAKKTYPSFLVYSLATLLIVMAAVWGYRHLAVEQPITNGGKESSTESPYMRIIGWGERILSPEIIYIRH